MYIYIYIHLHVSIRTDSLEYMFLSTAMCEATPAQHKVNSEHFGTEFLRLGVCWHWHVETHAGMQAYVHTTIRDPHARRLYEDVCTSIHACKCVCVYMKCNESMMKYDLLLLLLRLLLILLLLPLLSPYLCL